MFAFGCKSYLIRTIKTSGKEIFLTFDDGPCPESTPLVLDILKHEKVKASFFVIGDRARQNPEIIKRTLAEGHSIFSHSLDHNCRNYFRNENDVLKWLQVSLADLSNQTALVQKVFRPPAGVLTPPLLKAAQRLKVPLILWNHRFYDSVFSWNQVKAQKSIKRLAGGDIILLHDAQKQRHRNIFLKTLSYYLQTLRSEGFQCIAISHFHIDQEATFDTPSIG